MYLTNKITEWYLTAKDACKKEIEKNIAFIKEWHDEKEQEYYREQRRLRDQFEDNIWEARGNYQYNLRAGRRFRNNAVLPPIPPAGLSSKTIDKILEEDAIQRDRIDSRYNSQTFTDCSGCTQYSSRQRWFTPASWRSLDREGDCFVATVVYGDINAPQVQKLRQFRDDVLMEYSMGRLGVSWYYSGIGRGAAALIKNYIPSAIPPIRKVLDVIVELRGNTQGT
ncbi:hypothetical protein HZB02_02825 [Candidatus Woesearchaeota archaeon]|nr:hypothetical protein [Candidatus Woesearchaeota archaeon]